MDYTFHNNLEVIVNDINYLQKKTNNIQKDYIINYYDEIFQIIDNNFIKNLFAYKVHCLSLLKDSNYYIDIKELTNNNDEEWTNFHNQKINLFFKFELKLCKIMDIALKLGCCTPFEYYLLEKIYPKVSNIWMLDNNFEYNKDIIEIPKYNEGQYFFNQIEIIFYKICDYYNNFEDLNMDIENIFTNDNYYLEQFIALQDKLSYSLRLKHNIITKND